MLAHAEPVILSGRAMGTRWSAKVSQPPATFNAADVERRLAERLEELEQKFSSYRTQSIVSRFNAEPTTEWVPVPRDVAQVGAECARISALTRGAFDVTVAPLVALWGFGPQGEARRPPADDEINVARARVGWTKLETRAEPPALRKRDANLMVDFSSMAKGFAADAMSEVLTSLRARDHLVQVGGDVKTAGAAEHARGWTLGIETPQPSVDAGPVAAVVVLAEGAALSTSGDSRNAFVHDGRRYGHIIDPRTGRPVASHLASVSVVRASCAESSALATGLFVLGPDEGLRVAEAQGIAALFLVREGNAIVRRATPEFDQVVRR